MNEFVRGDVDPFRYKYLPEYFSLMLCRGSKLNSQYLRELVLMFGIAL
jgi:hypothetical protein